MKMIIEEILPEWEISFGGHHLPVIDGLLQHGWAEDGEHLIENARAAYVGAQCVLEAAIAVGLETGQLTAAQCVIHAEKPTTVLCYQDGDDLSELVSEEVLNNLPSLETVTSRHAQFLRCLELGMKFGSVFTAVGKEGRTPTQQLRYEEFEEMLGFDSYPLEIEKFPSQLSGATYAIQMKNGEKYWFLVRAYQAKTMGKQRQWQAGLGTETFKGVQFQVKTINNFLSMYSIPVLGI